MVRSDDRGVGRGYCFQMEGFGENCSKWRVWVLKIVKRDKIWETIRSVPHSKFWRYSSALSPVAVITFCVSRRRHKMYCGHARLCVCLSAALRPHYCTDPDVTWRHGRGCPLVVHYWADLQSRHGLRCYGNITRTLVTSLRPSRDMTT